MKQTPVRVIVILFAVLGIVLLLYFIYNDGEKRHQWFESYRANSEEPYGTLFIQKLLETYRPGHKVILNEKQPLKNLLAEVKAPDKTDYVFIGQSIYLDSGSADALIKFMNAGGDVLIASLESPDKILDAVYFRECEVGIEYQFNQVESVNLNFFHQTLKYQPGFKYAFRHESEDQPYPWNFISEGVFCDSTKSIVPLGYQDGGNVNFIRIPTGSGNLYLHSNPLVFTNYFLAQPEKIQYVSGVFSHLDGNDIIWDEYNKIPYSGDSNAYNSPLYYILQQPSLKYAWWLMLLSVTLYVLFAAKRKERVIPVLEQKTNTSLEFVKLISRLHYKNGNHLNMARKKMKYFLYFVRSKYGIHAENFNDEHIGRLAEKSKVNINDVAVIFSQYYLIEEKFKDTIEANRLVDLYESIENFYKQCK